MFCVFIQQGVPKKLARDPSEPASFFIATPRNPGFRPNPSQFLYSDSLSFFTHSSRHIPPLAWNQVKAKKKDFPDPNRHQTAPSFFIATPVQFFFTHSFAGCDELLCWLGCFRRRLQVHGPVFFTLPVGGRGPTGRPNSWQPALCTERNR